MNLFKATKSPQHRKLRVHKTGVRFSASPILIALILFLVFDLTLSSSFDHEIPDYSEDLRLIKEELKWREINQTIWIQYLVPDEYQYFFEDWNYSYDAIWLAKIISVESNWIEYAVSPKNFDGSSDYGLAQLNSNYISFFESELWKSPGVFDPMNGHHSLLIAASQLEFLFSVLQNEENMVKGYNIGIGSVLYGWRTTSGNRYFEKVQNAW